MDRRTFLKGTSLAAAGSLLPLSGALALASGATNDDTVSTGKERVKSVEELMTRKTREVIDQGLRYLAHRQISEGNKRGAFGTAGYAAGVAVTALAGLAFLCNGSTPVSGPYQKNIKLCTEFILKNVRSSGYISENDTTRRFSNMYGHGYAMLYLSQVYGMSKQRELEKKLAKAIKMTCEIQNNLGGWRYQPVARDADLSITICQVMALRAAHSAGFQVSDEVRTKTIEYVDKCHKKDGSFQYTEKGGRISLALTAAGVVSYYSAGIYEGPKIEASLKWIYNHRPGKATRQQVSPMNYYYAHYYAVQAMWHAQLQHPEYWNTWYPLIRDELIDTKRSRDGTWADSRVGPEFGTAMSCIILQIPFNYVPVFSP